LWYAAHLGSESEHQVLNGSHIFVSFTLVLLFGSKFQYSRERRQDEEGKSADKAAIRDLVLTFFPISRSVQQRKLELTRMNWVLKTSFRFNILDYRLKLRGRKRIYDVYVLVQLEAVLNMGEYQICFSSRENK